MRARGIPAAHRRRHRGSRVVTRPRISCRRPASSRGVAGFRAARPLEIPARRQGSCVLSFRAFPNPSRRAEARLLGWVLARFECGTRIARLGGRGANHGGSSPEDRSRAFQTVGHGEASANDPEKLLDTKTPAFLTDDAGHVMLWNRAIEKLSTDRAMRPWGGTATTSSQDATPSAIASATRAAPCAAWRERESP
jgi:hypothetical protein